MNLVKKFLKILCEIDLADNPRKTVERLYDEIIDTLDVDLEEKGIKKDATLPPRIRTEIVDLIEYYYTHADDSVNIYSREQRLTFLKILKKKAMELQPYMDFR